MILPPSEWYAKQDLSQHFMRRTDRPFEDGVSRGQLRRIAKCEAAGMVESSVLVLPLYDMIMKNRESKGRRYRMSIEDWLSLFNSGAAEVFQIMDSHHAGIIAGAFCVKVSETTLYVSAWGDIDGQEKLSPVCLLAKIIYIWCQRKGFHTLDIGIAGDENLANFKRRLGFRRACDD